MSMACCYEEVLLQQCRCLLIRKGMPAECFGIHGLATRHDYHIVNHAGSFQVLDRFGARMAYLPGASKLLHEAGACQAEANLRNQERRSQGGGAGNSQWDATAARQGGPAVSGTFHARPPSPANGKPARRPSRTVRSARRCSTIMRTVKAPRKQRNLQAPVWSTSTSRFPAPSSDSTRRWSTRCRGHTGHMGQARLKEGGVVPMWPRKACLWWWWWW